MAEKKTKKDEAAEATERVMDAIVTQALAPSQKVSESIPVSYTHLTLPTNREV